MTIAAEPQDSFIHSGVEFEAETIEFLRTSVRFADDLLAKEVDVTEIDPALTSLLGPEEGRSLPIDRIRRQVNRCRGWLDGVKPDSVGYYELEISHGRVKLLKSAVLLYLRHLRISRNSLATRPNLSRHLLEAIDQKITKKEELLSTGVFRNATTIPLLVDEVVPEQGSDLPRTYDGAEPLAHARRPRPVLLSTVEILDSELNGRCVDLLEQFRETGDHERLDTVVAEAMRVLEDRLRRAAGASATCIGVNLATYAFGGTSPRLVLSATPSEQDGGMAIFRGIFAFIRNQVQHKLVDDLTPDRALQIVAMVDYMLFLTAGATRSDTSGG